jgi:hypothetical protein
MEGENMKLFLISQDKNNDYDTYDSAVVAAETEDAARMTHPDGYGDPDWPKGEWKVRYWAPPDDVAVKYLGIAAEGTEPGVICASFNAG